MKKQQNRPTSYNKSKLLATFMIIIVLVISFFIFISGSYAHYLGNKFYFSNPSVSKSGTGYTFSWNLFKITNSVVKGPARIRIYTTCNGKAIGNNGRFEWDIDGNSTVDSKNYTNTVALDALNMTGTNPIMETSLYTLTIGEKLEAYGPIKVPSCAKSNVPVDTVLLDGVVYKKVICTSNAICQREIVPNAIVTLFTAINKVNLQNSTLYKQINADANGKFSIQLPVGIYYIGAADACSVSSNTDQPCNTYPKPDEIISINITSKTTTSISLYTSSKSVTDSKTGIHATVVARPGCGVVKIGETCPDKQVINEQFKITSKSTNGQVLTVKTTTSGEFTAHVAPGTYFIERVESTNGMKYPICKSTEITVEAEKVSELLIVCDSGIR